MTAKREKDWVDTSGRVILKADFVVAVKYVKGVTVVIPDEFPRYLAN